MFSGIFSRFPTAQCFYDINLRDGHWNLPLVQRLSSLASIVKLNETEAYPVRTRTSVRGLFIKGVLRLLGFNL